MPAQANSGNIWVVPSEPADGSKSECSD